MLTVQSAARAGYGFGEWLLANLQHQRAEYIIQKRLSYSKPLSHAPYVTKREQEGGTQELELAHSPQEKCRDIGLASLSQRKEQ